MHTDNYYPSGCETLDVPFFFQRCILLAFYHHFIPEWHL